MNVVPAGATANACLAGRKRGLNLRTDLFHKGTRKKPLKDRWEFEGPLTIGSVGIGFLWYPDKKIDAGS